MSSFKEIPIDETSRAALEAHGLRFEVVDTDDTATFETFVAAVNRGFHGPVHPPEHVTSQATGVASRRNSAVYDASIAHPDQPVGTVNSWLGTLAVPGDREVDAWAISFVTVAPTHRRRGIARNLLEAELRTAVAAGAAIAMLTVSESTIYGRFGFAPAAMAADYKIDAKAARWVGPTASGRVDFLEITEARVEIEQLHERIRVLSPGEVGMWPRRWDQVLGIVTEDPAHAKSLRAVRHADESGTTRGIAVFRLKEEHGFSGHTLEVEKLFAETPDAYAALWRFLLEMDLVSSVSASLRSVDEPLRWQIADFRAAQVTTYDHLWLRILDVKAALEARSYEVDAELQLVITDDLGMADGYWNLSTENGVASVERKIVSHVPEVTLSVQSLSAIYLGGVRATTLQAAGLIEGDAELADRIFASQRTPWLGMWF
ncbi:GNAT family N-acetyltransferase [soil metagenome]